MGTSSDKKEKKYTFQLCGIIDSKNQDYFLSGMIFPNQNKSSSKFDETDKKNDHPFLQDNGQIDSDKLGVNQSQVRVLNTPKNPNGNEYPIITSEKNKIGSTKIENMLDDKINGGEINNKYESSSILKKGEEFEKNNLFEDGKEEDEQSSRYPNLSNISFENDNKRVESPKNKDPHSLIKSIIQEPIKEDFSKVEIFMRQKDIQDEFLQIQNTNKTYMQLKKFEKGELTKFFLENIDNFEKKNFQKEELNLNFDTKLLSDIIEKENTKNVFRNKIIKEIGIIKEDQNKYKIDHLTILLVGKRKIDKKSLIKYILKLKDSELKALQSKEKDFQAFQSSKIPYLRLIKYKGIGYGLENNAEVIIKQTIDYIKRQNKKGSYNDFVHCIWHCISGQRMERLEDEYLEKLRKAYSNVNLPIILIYLNEYSETKIKNMEKKIKEKLDVDFINVIARQIKIPKNGGIEEVRGENELLNLTLNKCKNSLQGDMPKIMMKNISNEILYKMKNLNEVNRNKIKDLIKGKFINEFKSILKDNEFIDYIINLLGRNLNIFYGKTISNISLNLIANSEIIANVKNFMNNCKEFTKNLISEITIIKSKEFINQQVILEKINKENINIENKRDLKGFKKTNEIFLKQNFYYLSQKYIIYNFILYYCNDYFKEFQNNLNLIIEDLINSGENSDINKYIEDCFGAKLIKFGEKMKFNFNNINFVLNIDPKLNLIDDKFIDTKLLIEDENNSFNLDLMEEESDHDIEEKENIEDDGEKVIDLSNILNLKTDWRYLNNDLSITLNNFIQMIKYQDTPNNYFNKNNFFNNSLLNSLKKYEKNNLELYFNATIQQFLISLDKNFLNIREKYRNKIFIESRIKSIFQNEKLNEVLLIKINQEFEDLKKNKDFVKIDYFTAIITGRTGVGKSSLINALLKQNLAEEGMKDIVTTKPQKYENQIVQFLKLIDTRGFEIKKEYGFENISNEIKKIIDDPNELNGVDEKLLLNKIKTEIKYNDYVQCVWYCVNGSSLEKEEIEFINSLRVDQTPNNKIPIIIVYTISEDMEKIEKMEKDVKKYLNDIPFIYILSKDDGSNKSFGLDGLVKLTVAQCKTSYKCHTFNLIKQKVYNELIDRLKNKNRSIKFSVNNETISYFINNYNQTLLENDIFKKYIYDLFSIIFSGYLKIENIPQNSKRNLSESINREFDSTPFPKYINEYINCYKEISRNFIDQMKEEKALKFLDEQAKIEKKNNNLEIKDKCDKSNFIHIIHFWKIIFIMWLKNILFIIYFLILLKIFLM